MNQILKKNIKDVIEDKYLSYAISTIISRSLPDVRDGLKPVHRRIIFSMYELNLRSTSQFKKCARIVGDVMGKFHPHGDQAIYDSLIRMAQNFSIRYPLIEGQGNFGNIDGDNAAAMRYTEARLNKNADVLLNGLDQDAVDFVENYDGQNREPIVLPSLLPNIILNGSSGIAVGMATNIPPHNVKDVIKTLIELINNKNVKNNKLIKIIKGPDLPTAGEILIDNQNLKSIYEKGKGNFTIKSKWKKIDLGKGQYNIEINEIPYQVNKTRIIENIATLIKNKKIPLDDIWDESDEKIRIILKPKNRNVEAIKLMEVLFKSTDLSIKYHCNFNVLIDGVIPKLLGIKDILLYFLRHRKLVIKRISSYKIKKINTRIKILLGFLIVYKNLKKIISIIRNSKDPKKEIMKKYKISEMQTIAILEMKLRSLRKIEENDVMKELKNLKKELLFLNKLLNNKKILEKYLINEFELYLKDLNDEESNRKTNIIIDKNIDKVDSTVDYFEEVENITLICLQNDNLKIYKGHIDIKSLDLNSEDKVKYYLKVKSNDKINIFTNDGRVYCINPNTLPGGKSKGSNFSLLVNIKNSCKIIGIEKYEQHNKYLLISNNSRGFTYSIDDEPNLNKNGKQIFNLKKDDYLIKVIFPIKKFIATVSSLGKLLIFKTSEIPILKKSSGVIIQKIKNGYLSDVQSFDQNESLQWYSGKQIKQEYNYKFWIGKRSQIGKKIPRQFSKSLKFTK